MVFHSSSLGLFRPESPGVSANGVENKSDFLSRSGSNVKDVIGNG